MLICEPYPRSFPWVADRLHLHCRTFSLIAFGSAFTAQALYCHDHAGASSSSGWGDAVASSSTGHTRAGPSVQCGICFESYAASDMVAAYQPPEAACSSTSTGRCSHLYCTGCMQGYVQEKVQVCGGSWLGLGRLGVGMGGPSKWHIY
jgi:hypothetical protein